MQQKNRIIIIDALRGLALLLIILIHYIEHFELFMLPQTHWFFSESTDQEIFKQVFFFVGGKAYSIFALMFGFSFFIQLNRAEQRGEDFRRRFAWRLTILLVMGFIHSLIYKGDILHIYAIMGFFLLPFYKLKVKHLIIIGSLFLIQVPTIVQVIKAYLQPEFSIKWAFGADVWPEINNTFATGTFWDVIKMNLLNGRLNVWAWTFYTNRYLQLFGLFIAGLILGKVRFFEQLNEYRKLIIRVVFISPLVVAILLYLEHFISTTGSTDFQKQILGGLIHMYSNIAFTTFYCSVLILIHLYVKKARIINSLAAYGKMSLSNYVFQAIFGVFFFYEFGFGMWKHMGATWSLIMAVGFYVLQVEISKFWISRYYYGPLEWFWRALTNFDFSIKMKREEKIVISKPLIKLKRRA